MREKWKLASGTATALVGLMLAAGAAGFLLYVHKPLRAAIGIQSEKEYLEERAPDYQIAETVNRLLSGRENQQETLVFFRHLYYLNIPFVNGDPDTSFEVDPERVQTPQQWKAFLKQKNIGYVVRSPELPEPIAAPLDELEKTGDLIPFARADVQNFQGNRLEQNRISVPVVILRVKR